MVNTITERQVTYINALQEERELYPGAETALEYLRRAYREEFCSKSHASRVIDLLLLMPKKAPVETLDRFNLTAGIYLTPEERVIRVYEGQQSGHMLAKEVTPVPDGGVVYIYLGLASQNVPVLSRRLTRDEVNERSLAYGSTTCLICGRKLDVPESVDRGIGPVCWENYS